ncbi:MAG: histidine phosphatase family protein [Alphaproteobacteria bacterium]
MRVLIIRHGQSEGNVDYQAYLDKGDSKVALTDLGWKQAIAAGEFLENYYEADGTKHWPYVFLSAYQRTQETLSGIVHGMRKEGLEGEPQIHLDPRLIERFAGATQMMKKGNGPVDWRISGQFGRMAEGLYKNDDFVTRNLLGDSSKDIYMAVQSFMDGTMRRVDAQGDDDMLIVAHGVVYREFVRAMGDLPFTANLPIPGNCDILEARKDWGDEGWRVRQIYDGEAMMAVDIPLLDGHHPYSFADLPPVPDHLK